MCTHISLYLSNDFVSSFPRPLFSDVLLIKELIKHTPKEHADRPQLEAALKSVEIAAKAINESTREAEQRKEILALEAKFIGGIKLVQPGR